MPILYFFLTFQIEIFIAILCLAQVAGYSCPEEEFGFLDGDLVEVFPIIFILSEFSVFSFIFVFLLPFCLSVAFSFLLAKYCVEFF